MRVLCACVICPSLSVTCDRSVVFSGSSGFLHQLNWPPRYNWTIVESGVKQHKTKPNLLYFFFWPLCWLFFDMRILITPSVSSNSSYNLCFHSWCITTTVLLLHGNSWKILLLLPVFNTVISCSEKVN